MIVMRNRVLQRMVSLLLILILFPIGVCAILSLHGGSSECQKDKFTDAEFSMTLSGLCKVPPCSINKIRLFTLPDLSFRRSEKENRSVLHNSSPISIPSVIGASPDNQILKAALKIPLSIKPPPIFYLHCTLIC